MRKQPAGPRGPAHPVAGEGYWGQRIRSKPFKRALTSLIAQELQSLAGKSVKDVLDAELIRTAIREWDARMVDRKVVADLIIQANRRLAGRLRQQHGSLLDLLDRQLVDDIEALLEEDVELSAQAEDFIADVMQQEFVRRLFTDIIFTAIVSFNQRVNPFFGAITMRVLDEQIKGFIRLFMPALQKQATAFAVSKENQRILLGFTRSIVRQLLEQPLSNYADLISPGRHGKGEAAIRKAVGNAKLDSLIRQAVLAAWDDLYRSIHDKKVGELLRVGEHAAWLAEQLTEFILPMLARPRVLRFVSTEMALAAARQRE